MDTTLPLLLALVLAGVAGWRLMAMPTARPHPGRVLISPHDPLLRRARSRARATLPKLRALLSQHRARAMVKLPRSGADGIYRGQWADILHWDDEIVRVRARGRVHERDVRWPEVEDWQVELPDGGFRGGYTVIAVWRIRERETGELPSEARRQLPRFRDA